MQIPTQQALNQAIAQFGGSLPTFLAVLLAWINSNARISDANGNIRDLKSDLKDLKSDIKELRSDFNQRITQESQHTRDLLCEGFKRVEEVMDARLKHLEEREH